MTIPSSVDSTLAPPGSHVVQLFTQYTPYKLASGLQWTDDMTNAYADTGLETDNFSLSLFCTRNLNWKCDGVLQNEKTIGLYRIRGLSYKL